MVMKKSMPEYITTLSENDFEILEEIFIDKYDKFLNVYWLIRDYSDYITTLKYKKTSKETLKIEFTVAKLSVDKVINEINSNVKADSGIEVSKDSKIIKIKITKDESVSS